MDGNETFEDCNEIFQDCDETFQDSPTLQETETHLICYYILSFFTTTLIVAQILFTV